MGLRLELKLRKPRWYEKKWKPKKPVLYLLEYVDGKWSNTYWWGGNWRSEKRLIRFYGSGEVGINPLLVLGSSAYSYVVVGRSGTTLAIDGIVGMLEIKSLHPGKAEWTRFGEIDDTGTFTVNLASFDFTEEIKKSLG
jgi:hypothetical protein